MSLDILKLKLQEALNESMESEHFIEAISDGVYSSQFETATALEQWLKSWLSEPCERYDDVAYQEGVQFVANLWEEIKTDS